MLPHETSTPGYVTQSPDTAEWADRMQFEHWGAMSPAEKWRLVANLCDDIHRLTLIGLARRHPEASAQELEWRDACRRLGRETVEQVLGHPLPFPP